MTSPAFVFRNAATSRGLISSGEGSAEFYHPILPVTLRAAAGFLLLLNGWNLNRSMADTLGHDGTAATAIQLLQMRAPREAILPLLSWVGDGRVFRPGAKWRYRWRDSRTGRHSGLSPLPDVETNVGVESLSGATTYLGQNAYFYIPTSGKPASADTIDLFANTTQEDDAWYLADAQPTGSASYVLLTDDNTDDELFTQLAVVTGNPSAIPAGPSWSEGIMPPLAKAWKDPGGRVRYFGLRRFGLLLNLSLRAAVTQGSDLLTISATSAPYLRPIEQGRVGQRVRFYASGSTTDPIDDSTVYRLVQAASATTLYVDPPIQASAELAAGASASWALSIEDDRDARWTWISEPNKPWLIDPLKVLAAGDDFDDGAMAWFALTDGRVFLQTKRRIYLAADTSSADPSLSTLFLPVAEEGIPGFDAGCLTPFGWVYVHETRGVRLFDGVVCRPLGRDPDPYGDFKPLAQFQNFDPSAMESVVVSYDAANRVVLVAYVPLGQSTLKEVLGFSTVERCWRGPWRTRISATGLLRSTATADQFVVGDDLGNLSTREAQSLDLVPTVSGMSGTGTLSSATTKRIMVDVDNHFTTNSDESVRGAPIWFLSGTTRSFARIVDVLDDNTLELDGPPVDEDGNAVTLAALMTYGIGSIRWTATTGYLDGTLDPAAPTEAYKLNLRFLRGTASDTFEVGDAENASGTFAGVRTSASASTAPTADTLNNVHAEMRLKRGGAALHQLRFRGVARNGGPQITRAVLVGEAREGALPT